MPKSDGTLVRILMLVCCVAPLALGGCGSPAGDDPAAENGGEADDGWITLFDGTSTEGWVVAGDANWTLEDGYVEASSGFGFLVTPESYDDFELRVEFWTDDVANSGVFFRCSNPEDINDMNAYEVNIYDMRPDQTGRTGAIVNVAPPEAVIDAAGQWNTFEISADGSHLEVVFNGTRTVDVEDEMYAEGPIGLQYGAGVVRFRSVQIRPL